MVALSDHVLCHDTGHPLDRIVPRDDPAIIIYREHCIGKETEDIRQAFPGFLLCLFRPDPLLDMLPLTECTPGNMGQVTKHRRRFDHVINCPGFHDLHGEVFIPEAGHDDKGDRHPPVPAGQDIEAFTVREDPVGDDQVRRIAINDLPGVKDIR